MSTDAFAESVFPRLLGQGSEREREQARLRGYAAGHAEGFRIATVAVEEAARRRASEQSVQAAEAEAALGRAVAAVDLAAARFVARIDEMAALDEQRILEHAVELAELIIAGELTDAGRAATVALHRAMSAVGDPEVLEIRLHPADVAVLETSGLQPSGIPVRADDELSPGDAVLAVPDGVIDARVGGAFDRVRRTLREDVP
ncbi:FliH/SctL family protein [Microbacterium sp. NPDC056234]|uniref:FliH/SctL family protein n=1 Tax=Microbacterium sp. NPDC056234 TaxID=3345757 RepID=UPI0035DD7B4F